MKVGKQTMALYRIGLTLQRSKLERCAASCNGPQCQAARSDFLYFEIVQLLGGKNFKQPRVLFIYIIRRELLLYQIILADLPAREKSCHPHAW